MTIQGPKNERGAALSEESLMRRPASADGVRKSDGAPRVAVVKPAPVPDMRELQQQIAQRLQDFLRSSGRDVEFTVDDVAHATVITVRRSDTGEVVRQYPTEEALALLRRLNERSGTLLDILA
jgi:flagellar protein FlaG